MPIKSRKSWYFKLHNFIITYRTRDVNVNRNKTIDLMSFETMGAVFYFINHQRGVFEAK